MLALQSTVRSSPLADLNRVAFGQGISFVGSYLTAVTVPWLVLGLTGSGFALGLSLTLSGLPRLLLMLPAGVVADRYSPRRVAVVSSSLLGCTMGLLGVSALLGRVTVAEIYAAGLIVGIAGAFQAPAYQSLVAQTTPRGERLRGNARAQGVMWVAQLAASGLAAVALGLVSQHHTVVGSGVVFVTDAATYGLCLALLRTTSPASPGQRSGDLVSSFGDGIRFVYRERGLLYVLAGSACFSVAITGLFQVGIPVRLHQLEGNAGARAFSLIVAAFTLGGTLGAAICRVYPPLPHRTIRLQYGIAVVEGLIFALAALSGQTWQLAAGAAVVGCLGSYSSIGFVAMIQEATADAVMSRVMSLMGLISAAPVSLLFPIIGDYAAHHTSLVFVTAGVIMLAGGLLIPLSWHVRVLPYKIPGATYPR